LFGAGALGGTCFGSAVCVDDRGRDSTGAWAWVVDDVWVSRGIDEWLLCSVREGCGTCSWLARSCDVVLDVVEWGDVVPPAAPW